MTTIGQGYLGEYGVWARPHFGRLYRRVGRWVGAQWQEWYKYPEHKQALERLKNPVRLVMWLRWRRRKAAYYAQLPAMRTRHFGSNYERLQWKGQQAFQRWLWRNNKELARKLATAEKWVWE